MEREGPEEEQGQLIGSSYDLTPTKVITMDDSKRLEMLMKKAADHKINKRFFKIDAQTYRIVDVIGKGEWDIPKEMLINATPEDLIKNQPDLISCRQAIQSVIETGDPMFQKLSISIGGKTFLEQIHFKRGNRETDVNTIIAYAD